MQIIKNNQVFKFIDKGMTIPMVTVPVMMMIWYINNEINKTGEILSSFLWHSKFASCVSMEFLPLISRAQLCGRPIVICLSAIGLSI